MNKDICCICLDFINIDLDIKTTCCNKYIHKSCLLTWIIYSGKIECCLCRSKVNFLVKDFITYDINNIKQYNIDRLFFDNNCKKILSQFENNYIINIDNSNNSTNSTNSTNFDNTDNSTNSDNTYYKYKYNKKILLFLIPVFYILLFFILTEYHGKYKIKN